MKKAESISLLIYRFGFSAAFFPFVILVCRNCYISSAPVIPTVFFLCAVSAMLNAFTPKRYCRYLSLLYTIILTAVMFLTLNGVSLFYRTLLSGTVFLPCILFAPKRKSILNSVYLFAGVSFADIIICIVYKYSFSEVNSSYMLIYYMLYAASFGFMVYCKSGSDFFRKSGDGKINPAVIAILLSSLILTALLSFPLSELLSRLFYSVLRLLFKNAGGGNTQRPRTENDFQRIQPSDTLASEGGSLVKYIFIVLITVMVIWFIFYMRREIAEFIAKIPQKFRKKALVRKQNEEVISCEEYTDYIVYIQPSQTQLRLVSPEKLWSKKLKAYKKADWSEKTMRNGLELAQNGLRLCGFEIKGSDTVMSIEKKLPEDLARLWHRAAVRYMDCRYNGAVPDDSDKIFFDELIGNIDGKTKSFKYKS